MTIFETHNERSFPLMRRLVPAVLLLLAASLYLAHAQGILPAIINSGSGNRIVYENSCNANAVNVTSLAIALHGAAACNNGSYTPASGDVVAVWVITTNAITSPSCTDTNSNSWTTPTQSSAHLQFVTSSKLTTGGNTTVTCTWTTSSPAQAQTWESVGTQNVLDGSIQFGSISSGSPWSLPSLTTTDANDVVLGFGGESGTSVSFSQSNPWVYLNSFSGSGGLNSAVVYRTVQSTGTYTPQINISPATSGVGTTLALESQ